jgi:hypothetical protein
MLMIGSAGSQIPITSVFIDQGGGRFRAFNTVQLGQHYHLENADILVDTNANTITGNGTLYLSDGDLALFSGAFNVNANSQLAVGAGVYDLNQIGGFGVGGSLAINNVDLVGGQSVGTANVRLNPPGIDQTAGVNFYLNPGPVFSSDPINFSFGVSGVTISAANLVLGSDGFSAGAFDVRMPPSLGNGTGASASRLVIKPDTMTIGSVGASFPLPDIALGGGDGSRVALTNLQASVRFAGNVLTLGGSGVLDWVAAACWTSPCQPTISTAISASASIAPAISPGTSLSCR